MARSPFSSTSGAATPPATATAASSNELTVMRGRDRVVGVVPSSRAAARALSRTWPSWLTMIGALMARS